MDGVEAAPDGGYGSYCSEVCFFTWIDEVAGSSGSTSTSTCTITRIGDVFIVASLQAKARLEWAPGLAGRPGGAGRPVGLAH